MKTPELNEVLMEVLRHVQGSARAMSRLTDALESDPLFKVSSADDELDFEEIGNIAEALQDDLLAMVPKLRLLIYIGAPKGTVYKKSKS